MTQEVLNQIIEGVLTLALLVVTGIIIPKVKEFISSKTNNTIMNAAMSEMLMQVDIAVTYVEQTMVSQLKADGKWDTENQKKALDTAVDTVLANLSESALSYFQSNTGNLVKTVASYIESNIAKSKIK